MPAESNCFAYARSQRPRFVAEFSALAGFASVSTQPAHAKGVRNCAAAGIHFPIGLARIGARAPHDLSDALLPLSTADHEVAL
jgi:hypothetical protein